MKNIWALIAGIIFGTGLTISGMTDPQRVIGFLDLFGQWDPTLIFVMGAGVTVTLITFRWVLSRPAPLLDRQFYLPTRRDIDTRLLTGSALFGIGWGIYGFCPGPAIASLAYLQPETLLFVAAMIGGSQLARISLSS